MDIMDIKESLSKDLENISDKCRKFKEVAENENYATALDRFTRIEEELSSLQSTVEQTTDNSPEARRSLYQMELLSLPKLKRDLATAGMHMNVDMDVGPLNQMIDEIRAEEISRVAKEEWLSQNGAMSLSGIFPIAVSCPKWWSTLLLSEEKKPWNDEAFQRSENVQDRLLMYKELSRIKGPHNKP